MDCWPTVVTLLKAWAEGHSAKHPSDIHAMLVVAFSDLSEVELDMQAIDAAAAQLGPKVVELWHTLRERVKREARQEIND